jgi:hypothetical protein
MAYRVQEGTGLTGKRVSSMIRNKAVAWMDQGHSRKEVVQMLKEQHGEVVTLNQLAYWKTHPLPSEDSEKRTYTPESPELRVAALERTIKTALELLADNKPVCAALILERVLERQS